MTQENKELLLKDLGARLSCNVMLHIEDVAETYDNRLTNIGINHGDYLYINGICVDNNGYDLCAIIKPYLRSMSSMTDEEKEELSKVIDKNLNHRDLSFLDGGWTPWVLYDTNGIENYIGGERFYFNDMSHIYDWLNAHHFDYRGLIEKGLALEAPEGMYKFMYK